MKKIKFLYVTFFLIFFACQEEEPRLETPVTPTNLVVSYELVGADVDNPFGDGSGFVNFEMTADNAVSYQISINNTITGIPNGEYEAISDFTELGVNSYTITAIALGAGGVSTSQTVDFEVFFDFVAPSDLLEFLHGDGTKTWRIKSEVGAHFGLGPIGGDTPSEFFGVTPLEKVGVGMYDDRYVFNSDGTFTHITNVDSGDETGTVFGREVLIEELDGPKDTQIQGADIVNYPFNDYTVNWTITAPNGIETINLTGIGFFGYYIGGNHSYEIFDRSQTNELLLRSTDGNGEFDWWFILTSEEEGSTDGGQSLETQFTNLTWSDEFNVDGAPDPANWDYDLGGGGFGNGESQVYTSDAENVIVENGTLSINAIATSSGDKNAFYVDDINQTNADGSTVNLLEDFEGTAPVFNNFGGSITQVIANPDPSGINTSATVTEFEKPTGAETYAGSSFDLPSALDLSTNTTFRIKTYSPKVGAIVKFKIENSADTSQSYEVDANTTVENVWEELVYDLSAAPDFTYDRIVIFFDFGNPGSSGASFTSARMKTEGLQEFTYGRAEIRAKLPTGGGTWPAIWMLGANFPTVGWPAAGEIDIMEHVGNQQDIIHGTTHDPNNFAGNGRTGSISIPGVSDDFHIYEMEWTATEIKFAVDGQVYHTVSNDSTLPYNDDFFFIMNVAMGGSFGGDIDPAFVESTMEVDYIRFYQ